jgi:hypothetical protein
MGIVQKLMRIMLHFNMGVLMAASVWVAWYLLEASAEAYTAAFNTTGDQAQAFCCLVRTDSSRSDNGR